MLAAIVLASVAPYAVRSRQPDARPSEDVLSISQLAKQVERLEDTHASKRVRDYEQRILSNADLAAIGSVPVGAVVNPVWSLPSADLRQLKVGVLGSTASPPVVMLVRKTETGDEREVTLTGTVDSSRLRGGVYWYTYEFFFDSAGNVVNEVHWEMATSELPEDIQGLYDRVASDVATWRIVAGGRSIPVVMSGQPR